MSGDLESRGAFSEDAVDAARDVDARVPTVRGPRYAPGGHVGRGGMGVVEAVTDRWLGREVARKRLRRTDDPLAAERLRREAAVAGSLEHPGIVAVYDVGEDAEGPWYTMRLVRGRTLAEVLSERTTTRERLALIRRFHQACEAVAYCHRRGVTHRDLKPANVMLGDEGQTQVVDWGLARPVASRVGAGDVGAGDGAPSEPALTAAGAVVGTPAYMSPEQAGAFGEPFADARSDVWALGAMLHELLSGRRLWSGDSSEVLRALVAGAPALAPSPDAPAELVAIAARALRYSPDERYPSAGELAEDLDRYLDGRLVAAHTYGALDHVRRFVRRFRLPLGVASVALVALVVGGAVAYRSVVAESERARAAELTAQRALAEAEEHNARLLGALATQEARRGLRTEAEALARRALELAPSPASRGVLASFALAAPPEVIGTAPRCESESVSPDGRLRLCVERGLARLREGDRTRFERPLAPTASAILTDAYAMFVGLDPEHRTAIVDVDGTLVSEDRLDVVGLGCAWEDELLVALADGVRWQRSSTESELLRPCDGGARVTAVALGPRGPAFACPDGTVHARDARWQLPTYGTSLAWLGDDLVVGTRSGELRLVSGARAVSLSAGSVLALATDPELRWVVASTESEGLWFWRPGVGLPERLPTSELRIAHLHRGILETQARDGATRWRLPTGPVARLDAGGGVASVDGRDGWVIVGRGDGCARLFDPQGREVASACGPPDEVLKTVLFDEERVVVHRNGAAHLEVLERDLSLRGRMDGGRSSKRVVRLASGAFVAVTYGVGRVRVERDGTLRMLRPAEANHLDLDAHGETAVALTADGRVARIRHDVVEELDVVPNAVAVALGPRDRVFVATRHAVTSEGVWSEASSSAITTVRVDAGGRWVAVGHRDGWVRILDARLREVASFAGHDERVSAMAWDGDVLLTGGWDGVVRRWDARHFE